MSVCVLLTAVACGTVPITPHFTITKSRGLQVITIDHCTQTHRHTHAQIQAGSTTIDPPNPASGGRWCVCDSERRYNRDTKPDVGSVRRDVTTKRLTQNKIKWMQMTGKVVKCLNSVSVYCELVVVTCQRTRSIRECICVCSMWVCVRYLFTYWVSLLRQAHWSESCVCVCARDARISFFRSGEWWELWSSVTLCFQYVTTEFQCNVSSASRYREKDSSQGRVLLPEAQRGKGQLRSSSRWRCYRALILMCVFLWIIYIWILFSFNMVYDI